MGGFVDQGVGFHSVCSLLRLYASPYEVTGNGANERLDVAWAGDRSRGDVCCRWVDGSVEAQARDYGRVVVWFSEVFVVCDGCVDTVVGWGDVAWFGVYFCLHINSDLLGAANRFGLENSGSSFIEYDGRGRREFDWIVGHREMA